MEGTILVTGPQRWTATATDGVRVRAHLRALLWACAAAALIAGCAVLWQTAGDTHYGRAHVHFPAPATTRRWPVAIHRAAALRWAPATQANGNGGARTAATNAVSDPRLLSAARQTGVRTAPAEAPGPLSVPRGEAAHAAVPPPPCASAACAPPPPAAASIPWRRRAFLAACGVFAVLSAVIRCRRMALGVAMAAATGETEPPPEGASAASDETGNAVGGVYDDEAYSSPFLALLSRLLPRRSTDRPSGGPGAGPGLADIEWGAAKAPPLPVPEMARRIEAGLRQREWFVTGRVLPELFAEDDFVFRDPDVTVEGLRAYAEGVHRLFDQATARAEVVEVAYDPARAAEAGRDVVVVTWRLSGRVNLGPFRPSLKPYVVRTDVHLRATDGLIVMQEDHFTIPSWDIGLSIVAPWLPFLAPPAPPVQELRAAAAEASGPAQP